MNGYDFTERIRKVLGYAREEAYRLGHGTTDTQHMLLGLLREGEGVGCIVLLNLGVDFEQLRRRVEQDQSDDPSTDTGPDLPYSSSAKRVLEHSMAQARQMEHSYVSTEHLLLGLLQEGRGVAARALAEMGVTLEAAQIETLKILGSDVSDEYAPKYLTEARIPKLSAEPSSILILMHYPGGLIKRHDCRSRRDALRFLIG